MGAEEYRKVQEMLGNQFGRALTEVLRTMAGFELVVTDSDAVMTNCPAERVTGMILLTGSVHLLLSLTMTKATLATLVSYMTGIPAFDLTEADLGDGLLELANMTAGQTKTQLTDSGYRFQITAPFGITGGDYQIISKERVPQMEKGYLAENMELLLRIFKI